MSHEVTIPAGDRMIRGWRHMPIHLTHKPFDTGIVAGFHTRCGNTFTVGGFEEVYSASSDDRWCRRCAKHLIADG